MIGLPGLEKYYSVFNITRETKKTELFTDLFDEYAEFLYIITESITE